MSSEEAPAVRCPLCHQLSGVEERLAVHEGAQIRVIVRCRECRHRWSVIKLTAGAGGTPTYPSDS